VNTLLAMTSRLMARRNSGNITPARRRPGAPTPGPPGPFPRPVW
jgi:hypothetical protein